MCYGEARAGRQGPELVHPEYRVLSAGQQAEPDGTLMPVYPSGEGLGQGTLRNLVAAALGALNEGGILRDTLPPPIREAHGLIGLETAIVQAHRPDAEAGRSALDAVHRRLALDELLAHHLSLRQARERLRCAHAPALPPSPKDTACFLGTLGFTLTGAQQRTRQQVAADLSRPRPMHRLLQGDVGSGKTVVAALAALQTVANGWQCAMMAPTEILAEQHLSNFRQWFSPLGIEVGWLASKMRARQKRETVEALSSGDLKLVVGTHALVQDRITFAKLGLAIIDEQHRFGVHQRLRLSESLGSIEGPGNGLSEKTNPRPHLLLMTATPIPRTLAMVAFADLDTSVIDELPPGRSPVETAVISNERRDEILDRAARSCRRGQQAYWICPLVEESEELDCQSATDTAADFTERLGDLTIGLVHGRLSSEQKDIVMARFKAGDIDLLVATTVVEVGVDVPNASVMVIESAERLGLSQLHQLRGRVGRGPGKSACVLLYAPPLSARASRRLGTVRATHDGFAIAEKDLELRGPGQLLGLRQAGAAPYLHADLVRDMALLPSVEQLATQMLDEYPSAAEHLVQRWMGDAADYLTA